MGKIKILSFFKKTFVLDKRQDTTNESSAPYLLNKRAHIFSSHQKHFKVLFLLYFIICIFFIVTGIILFGGKEYFLPSKQNHSVPLIPLTLDKKNRDAPQTQYFWVDKDDTEHTSTVEPQIKRRNNHKYQTTKIVITNNVIYIPVTLSKNGVYHTFFLLLEPNKPYTSIPDEYLNALKPHWTNPKSVSSTSPFAVTRTRVLLESLSVGPFHEGPFMISVFNTPPTQYPGILGNDFLSTHPFVIDYSTQEIHWKQTTTE